MLEIGEVHKWEWIISKGVETTESDKENGSLICLPSWHVWQVTLFLDEKHEIKRLEDNCFKT